MDQETSNEIAGQVNKAVSEFREEASKTDIAPIVKDLQRALEEQSQKTSTVEDYMQSSVESEKAVFADITRLSNSLGGILETQRGILESLKGLNDNIDNASQQQNTEISGGAGDNSLGGGAGDDLLMGGNLLSGGGSVASAMMGIGYGGGSTFDGTMGTGEGLTEEKNQAITDFAEKYNINPNALAGILNVESKFDTSSRGGAGNNYSGIFQLQSQQIAGLTESVFGDALTPEEYRNLSFEDQLKVYEQYMLNAVGDEGDMKDFFTGDAEQDTSRLWALQLAPGNAKNIDYSNPNALISNTRQAGIISAPGGGVTVGSAVGSLSMGGLLETENPMLTPLSLNWVGEELPEGITEGLNQTTLSDPISGESFSVEFEVENDGDKFITTGPVTLTEDTDLEGVSGVAGDAVEVSAEMAQDLAGQIGATIESSDLEAPVDLEEQVISDSETLMPEVAPPSIDLEVEPTVVDDASTAERNTESQAQPSQSASADYSESGTTPPSLTAEWARLVKRYYEVEPRYA